MLLCKSYKFSQNFRIGKAGPFCQNVSLRQVARRLIPTGRSQNEASNLKHDKTMIRPLGTRVVIEPKEAETMTAGGLYIPDNAKEKPQQGTVVAVGPGSKDEPMELKAGDVVLYGKYAGTEVTVDDKKYLIVKQSDILATL